MDEQVRIIVLGLDDVKELNEALGETDKLLKNLKTQTLRFNIDTASFSRANSEIDRARQGIESISKIFSGAGSFFSMSGRFAQSLGNSFSQMASLFETNFIDNVSRKLTYMFTHQLVGNMSNILNRADILNTFSSYMNLAGVTTFEAQQALKRVDLSIRGLPVGLDEAAQRLRRYQMITGNLDFAQNLTIGLQKALIAGGAPAYQRTTSYYEIERLLTSGGLGNSRQWMSLINGLGVSVRFIKEALGVEGMTNAEFISGLTKKDISTEEFLQAIAALGEGTVQAAKDLDEALKIYKTTYESWWSNIQFAFTRGGANVVNAISDALEGSTGKNIVGYMEVFRDGVNALFTGVANWSRGNGELFAKIIDSIRNLVTVFKGINGGEFATKLLDNFAKSIDLIAFAISKLATSQMGEFISFAMTLAGPLGKLFKLLGQGLPILLGIFERFKGIGFERIIDALVKSMESFANVVATILRVIPDSMLTWLMSFALVWGKPLGMLFKGMATGISALGSATLTASGPLANFAAGISTLGKSLATFAAPAAIIGGIMAIVYVIDSANKAFKELDDHIRSFAGSGTVDPYIAEVNGENTARRDSIFSARTNVLSFQNTRDRVRELIQEINALDGAIENEAGAISLRKAVNELNFLMPDWAIGLDELNEGLTENSRLIIENAESYLRADEIANQSELYRTLKEGETEAFERSLTTEAKLEGARRQYGGVISAYEQFINGFYELWPNEKAERGNKKFEMYLEETLGKNIPYSFSYSGNTHDILLDIAFIKMAAGANFARENIDKLEKSLRGSRSSQEDYANRAEDVNNYLEKLQNVDGFYKILDAAEEERAGGIESVTKALQEEAQAYEDLKNAALDSLQSYFSGYDEWESPEKHGLGFYQTNIHNRNADLDAYRKNLEELQKYREANPDDIMIQQVVQYLEAEGVEANYDLVRSLADALRSGNVEGAMGVISELYSLLSNEDIMSTFLADEQTAAQKHIDTILGVYKDAEDEFDEEAWRLAWSLNIAKYLNDYDMEIEHAAEGMVDAVERGIIKKGDALVIFMKQFGAEWARRLAEALSMNINPTIDITPSIRPNSGLVPIVGPEKLLYHDGGAVPDYLARGGWPSRGTDTVPAMLTPGEFVQKRAAVEMFGKKFMERVNALDIGGSIDAMSRKFGLPFMGGPFVNTSNVRDNHATVNQTNITNNQNFTYKKAFRFASGLA